MLSLHPNAYMQEVFRGRTETAEGVNVQSLPEFHTLWMKLPQSRETIENTI